MESENYQIHEVHTPEDIKIVRTLFESYEASLDTDLCFQQFEEELAMLPGDYKPPSGCLLMAEYGGQFVGCVAMRRLEEHVCEMKRLYVEPEFRGLKIGIGLIQETMLRARKIGYQSIQLDTLPSMSKAILLYKSLGFTDTDPYRHNPVPGARYMRLDLAKTTMR